MSQDPASALFTVIIPTKDRAEYLSHTLRTCSLQADANLEIIVSDDGSRDHTRAVVEEASRRDPRIRYVTPGPGAGMRENFEFALRQVKPGYVLALGGDDGLMPHGIRRMRRELQETGQEMLAWPPPAFFYPKTKMATGQLILHLRGGGLQRGKRIISSEEFLARQARALAYVGDIESPMFYVKAVVSTRLVDRVRSRSADGRFYACATPDGYSGIVLAGEAESWAFCGEPLSIHGVSPTSHGVGYLADGEQARKQSEAFFRSVAGRPMHPQLAGQPYSPLISLMTADYLLTASDLPGWPGKVPAISYWDLLEKGLQELADGLFARDRVARELAILYRIAVYHQLGEKFRRKAERTRRNLRQTLEGDAVSPSRLYLDASKIGIQDVFDAAYFAHHMHQFVPRMGLATGWKALVRSLGYRLRSLPLGPLFPSEAEWVQGVAEGGEG